MKLIKFIMVTALIFIFGDVFAQQNRPSTTTQDRISYLNHGTEVIGCNKYNSQGDDCLYEVNLTCRPATVPDQPSQVAVECFCSVSPDDSSTHQFFAKSIEFVGLRIALYTKEVARDVCLTRLQGMMENEPEEFTIDVTCSDPSICFRWIDLNRNGVYDLGETRR